MKIVFAIAMVMCGLLSAAPEKIWPAGNPDGWTNTSSETSARRGDLKAISNVNDPTLDYFPPVNPAKARPVAVIVCPGGGYNILAIDKEGANVAKWLSGKGYHAFVLKYRLPRKGLDKIRYQPALQDAQRAISIVNSRKDKLGIKKVGIMGFSAGGHLSAVAACSAGKRTYEPIDIVDKLSCRPDFTILIYPAYLIDKKTLKPAKEVAVPSDMPPVFIIQTEDDPIGVRNAVFFYYELKKQNVPAEMHVYPVGGHGYGMCSKKAVGTWPGLLLDWLGRL